ncbi:MAG: DEAD/DEAH box helicase [Verrucomicrobiota bacterium]|nr:DEAD/DEAH box helicase [Verrucomicrobiota bacterium]
MTTSERLNFYNKLGTFEQEVLQTAALLSNLTSSRKGLLDVLHLLEIRDQLGKKLTHQSLASVIDKLQDNYLLSYDCSVPKEIYHHILLRAVRSPKKNDFLKIFSFLETSFEFSLKARECIWRSLQFQFYIAAEENASQQTWAKITQHHEFHSMLAKFLMPTLQDAVWIEKLPDPVRASIYSHQLALFHANNSPLPDLQKIVAFLQSVANTAPSPQLAEVLIHHALFALDLRLISPSLLQQNEDLGLTASVQFIQGQFEEASRIFELALKNSRKELNLRKFVFPGITGVYYLLNLIRSKAYSAAYTAATFVIEKTSSPFASVFDAIRTLVQYLEKGIHLHKGTLDPLIKKSPPFDQAFILLFQYWCDQKSIAQGYSELEASFTAIKETLPGIARLLAEILVKEGTHRPPEVIKPYRDFLSETKGAYQIVFCDLVEVLQDWEHSLNALERLYALEEKDFSKETPSLSDKRLAWVVSLKEEPTVIGALEQKVNAKGEWSKGRSVAMQRLKDGAPDLEYATDQDRRAMQTIKSQTYSTYGYYTKEAYFFQHPRTLAALIGHPNIIEENSDTPLEFIKGSIHLNVQEKSDQIALSLSLPCLRSTVYIHRETPTRCQVIEVSDEHVEIQKIFGSTGELLIPKQSKKRITSLVKAIAKRLPVFSELGEQAVHKEGDPTPHLQMTPLDIGLKVNLFVYPFGEEGPFFKPGSGFATPTTVIKGKSQRVARNLSEEKRQKEQLINGIELFSSDDDQNEWVFSDPEEALELLSLFQSYPHPIKILWPSGKKLSVTQALTSRSLSLRIKGEKDWFSLEGQLQFNESDVISIKELLPLLEAHSGRFISLSDSKVLALTHHFEKQLRELKSLVEADRSSLRLHPLSSSALSEMLEEADLQADSKWESLKTNFRNAQSHVPVVPSTLQAELRSYQVDGFEWLSRLAKWGVGACLADDMGLGKTLQAITLMLEHAAQGPILVVAPTSVCHNWIMECTRFAPAITPILHSQERDAEKLLQLGPLQLLITSYGLLHQEIETLSKVQWQIIALDEAQSIKNFQTKRSQAAMQLTGKMKLILTGTPLENRLNELWNLFRFINPGLLGSQESFQKRFVDPIEQRKDASARQALKKLIRPFILRRLKSQVLTELPPKIEQTITVPFTEETAAFYEALRRNALEKLTDLATDKKRIHILAEITKLRRACCDPSLAIAEIGLSSPKIQALMELVLNLRENHHRALIFSQFVGFLEQVAELFKEKGISFQYLDGSTPQDERQKRVLSFQNGEGEFFLISLKAGGTGLNLTAADYVIHLDPWWNPAVEDQASDRAHRIGQTRPVTIYRLIMENSIEEKIVALHGKKRDLASDLLDGADLNGKLTEKELLGLLTV